MASLNTPITQLDASWQVLQQRWEATQALWRDPVQQDFEAQFWTLLERQVPATQQALARLAKVIAQAQREVK